MFRFGRLVTVGRVGYIPDLEDAMDRPILTKNTKVYIDGFSGLIAGKVVEMVSADSSGIVKYPSSASVRVTARTGRGYYHGEIVTRPVSMVIPRECVRRRKYGTRILPYTPLV